MNPPHPTTLRKLITSYTTQSLTHRTSLNPTQINTQQQCPDEEKVSPSRGVAKPGSMDAGTALMAGGKGLGKGGAKRHRKVLRDNIQCVDHSLSIVVMRRTNSQGYYQARYPTSRSTRWCQANLRSDLRRDPRRSQDLVRGRSSLHITFTSLSCLSIRHSLSPIPHPRLVPRCIP